MYPDEVGQVQGIGSGDAEAVAEIVPEEDAELGAGQQQAGEAVPAVASLIGAGAAGDPRVREGRYLRLVTCGRRSRSEPLVLSGTSGRSNTTSNSLVWGPSRLWGRP